MRTAGQLPAPGEFSFGPRSRVNLKTIIGQLPLKCEQLTDSQVLNLTKFARPLTAVSATATQMLVVRVRNMAVGTVTVCKAGR
jgi:hypothetical protein